jgi:hypothetical protein
MGRLFAEPFLNGDSGHAFALRQTGIGCEKVVVILAGWLRLWLLKIPNAPKSLEFLDSLTQYRRYA